jgi:hypothetical protein
MRGIRAEKAVLLAFWALAALGCVIGLVHPPSSSIEPSTRREIGDLVRIVCTTALVITLLLGPGLLWRPLTERKIGLGFVPLPGFAILAVAGGLVWVLVNPLGQQSAAFLVLGPVLGVMLGALLSLDEDLLTSEERRTLLIVGLPLGIAIARSVWSYGPAGEFFEATVSRSLNPEPRTDSRTSYLVAMLVATGQRPYHVTEALNFFAPYNFSARGPLPGMMSAPLMLLEGAKTKLFGYEAPWMPFDDQGFMVYRIAMMTFGATAYLSVWQLVRRIAGARAARFALVLAASTPFLIDDLWFTWPKLLAASFVILGAVFLVERKSFRTGLMVSVGYLMHPSALTGLFALGPLTAWPLQKARLLRPQIRAVIYLALGVAVGLVAWKLVNGHHYQQEGFLEYVEQAYPHYHPTVWQWIQFRLATLADTLVPFYLLAFHAHSASINIIGGVSPGVVHFFFQYWTGAPFGFGIFFYPLLLWSLYKALRRWPWPVTGAIVIPFFLFWIYWGASITGNLREGMQAWVLAVIAVIALQQWASGFVWFRSVLARLVMVLRAIEVLAVALGATLATHSWEPFREHFKINDIAAVGTVVILSLVLAWVVWRETAPDPTDAPVEDPVPLAD